MGRSLQVERPYLPHSEQRIVAGRKEVIDRISLDGAVDHDDDSELLGAEPQRNWLREGVQFKSAMQ